MEKNQATQSGEGDRVATNPLSMTSLNAVGESKVGPLAAGETRQGHVEMQSTNESSIDKKGEPGSRVPIVQNIEKSGEENNPLSRGASTEPQPSPPQECNIKIEDGTASSSKKNKADKTKPKLRKGKWTVEEEEYTSRIIHYFSIGLLTLPDGSTLRSYLAEKLNCDPMRITKKFTGACCLGRRVYHSRDRSRATPAEVELAKVELNHLEKRFRMRIEQEQSGIPFTRGQETTLQNRIFPMQHTLSANMMNPWANPAASNPLSLALANGNPSLQASLQTQYPFSPISSSTNPWLLPNTTETAHSSSSPSSSLTRNDPSLRILNNLVTSWAWAQASSYSPAMALLQQQQQTEKTKQQLRTAYEKEKKEKHDRALKKEKIEDGQESISTNGEMPAGDAKPMGSDTDSENRSISDMTPAQQLQRSYKAHLESLKLNTAKNAGISNQDYNGENEAKRGVGVSTNRKATVNAKGGKNAADEEAGTILLGFINSLRQSYEEAVEEKAVLSTVPNAMSGHTQQTKEAVSNLQETEKRSPETTKAKTQKKKRSRQTGLPTKIPDLSSIPISTASWKRHDRPASVTDTSALSRSETSSGTSSQPNEFSSSIEDSDSKSDKTDPSSSEESEKECTANKRNKGPPRKRMKTSKSKKVNEFTAKNLLEHSKRMSKKFDNGDRDDF